MSEELSYNNDVDNVVDIMKSLNSLPSGFEGDEREYYYNLAQESHPEWNLSSYQDTIVNKDIYTDNPDEIDISPELVNSLYSNADTLALDMYEQISKLHDISRQTMRDESQVLSPDALSQEDNIAAELEKIRKQQPYTQEIRKAKSVAAKIEATIGTPVRDFAKNYFLGQAKGGVTGGMTSFVTKQIMRFGGMFTNPDSYLAIKDEGVREAFKSGQNYTVPGMAYKIITGNLPYDIDISKYNDTFTEQVVGQASSFLDPIGLVSGYALYTKSSFLFAKLLKNNLPWLNPILQKWAGNQSNYYIGKSVGEGAAKLYAKRMATAEFIAKGTHTAFNMGNVYSAWGALHSIGDQRSNSGKYANNNGTINTWDTIQDIAKSHRTGATIGFLSSGVNLTLGSLNIAANKHWQMGHHNWRSFTGKYLFGTPTRVGASGAIMSATPIFMDEDVRKQYYYNDGSFKHGSFAIDVMFKSGMIYTMFGIDRGSFAKTKQKYTSDFAKDKRTREKASYTR